MKHLKLYEKKFNTNSLKKFAKEKDELYELIREYTVLNNLYEFDNNKHGVSDYYYETNYMEENDEVIIVITVDNSSMDQRDDSSYAILDLYDLNKFISDPIQYKKSLKYNL